MHNSKVVSHSKYLDFKSTKADSGSLWFYVKRNNDSTEHDSAVVITTLVKIKNKYNFLFLKTKRPPMTAEKKANYCLECPAGLIGDENKKENLEACLKKELLEETGLKADEIFVEAKNISSSCGLTSETLTFVTAIVKEEVFYSRPESDGGVILDRIYVPYYDIESSINSLSDLGYSVSGALICGVYFAKNRFRDEL